jgi:hypothetical protein
MEFVERPAAGVTRLDLGHDELLVSSGATRRSGKPCQPTFDRKLSTSRLKTSAL